MMTPLAAQQNDKPVVGIAEMQDLTGAAQADNFIAMIETAIIGSGKFRIIERGRLATLMKEQGLGRGGIVTTSTKKKTGGFEGVDYLIYGTITSISAVNKSNFGDNMLRGVLGGNRGQSAECFNTRVRMEADIRITDTNTGEVRYATRISEEQESATVCGGGSQIDSAGLFRSAADNVATGLVTTIFPIQVAAIQADGTVILNYGAGALDRGEYLMVYGQTTEIPDPSGTGMIKIDGEKVGAIQITDVQTSFSRAVQVTSFTVPLTVGAVARPVPASDVKALQKPSGKKGR
ncbi:CsgG/HfaB family protein [uncultured Erythrobacter sp.]|jgi:curli biogenesis system outer membrane secretion channel CsgG|uniref:CsgG/HfaB family protein n=1 Tax=uncultured Erythrobacter sp. TaxID=263913 RepID=UPI002658B13A|nr:CsgG/HfaB family protein [uncultured Erythrobacter sp.]